MNAREIPIELIDQPKSPLRGRIDAAGLEELADSIRAKGVLQPLLVKQVGDRFEVVAGHRRFLASTAAGLSCVPCVVLAAQEADAELATMLHENLFRTDLNPIEEAALYAELYDKYHDTEKIAAAVHRSRGVIESRLTLLAGDQDVRVAVQDEKISLGVAEQLNKVPFDSTRRFLLDAAIHDGASVEKVLGWRKMYHGVDVLAVGAEGTPTSPDPAAEVVPDANTCWLCGSTEDQHDLRVRLMHAGCERVMRRQAEAAAAGGKPNGGNA